MNFAYTILYVADVTRTVEFYEKAFGLKRRFIDPENTYAEMETGQTALAFAANSLAADLPGGVQKNDLARPPAGIEIAFTTPEVPQAFAQAVQAGATLVAEPKTKPWGQVVSYVRDLEGVLIEIASPM